MCEFHNSNSNGLGDIWWTDKCSYFSSIDDCGRILLLKLIARTKQMYIILWSLMEKRETRGPDYKEKEKLDSNFFLIQVLEHTQLLKF